MIKINDSLHSMKIDAILSSSISSKSLNAISRNIESGKEKLGEVVNAEEFFRCIAFMNAQAKAPRIERYLHYKLNQEHLKSSLGRGDGYSREEDKYYEYKISTTNKNKQLNALQIRIWQAIDYYILGYIDEEEFSNSALFRLTHEDMKKECIRYGMSATHGTYDSNTENRNVELTFRLKMDVENSEFVRFSELYRDLELERRVFGRDNES